ncbi:hypothetical protein F8M41_005193 [Gigaspora margarita]|uniref:Uncharacterized protein n=1 Tax=Gigaspora margarita TaxID=4874 RepID=A0A8H4AXE0_GIGMA|nr:hypothetical protein F8M41_005193 [Gigaspora margarita]
MDRILKNPNTTVKRNGVKNYSRYIKNSYPTGSSGSGLPGFPVKEKFLKEYLNYKVKRGKMKASSLEQYITNIKAHNEALGHSWNYSIFDVITKEVLDLLTLKPVNNLVPPNPSIPPPQSSDFSDSQLRQIFTEFNLQEDAVLNDDARPYLPSVFDNPNFVSLPTGINGFTQSVNLNTCPSFPPDNILFNQLLNPSLSLDTGDSLQDTLFNQLSDPHNFIQKLETQISDIQGQISNAQEQISNVMKQLCDAQKKFICLSNTINSLNYKPMILKEQKKNSTVI